MNLFGFRLPPAFEQFAKFCIVGTVGFVADAGTLYLLMSMANLDPYTGRIFSFLFAATVTWVLNRNYTFRGSVPTPRTRQWARFVSANAVGGALNYGVYSALILSGGWFIKAPVLAVAAGSIAGLAFNFTVSRKFVFKLRAS
jgi:putative flippase GtrA